MAEKLYFDSGGVPHPRSHDDAGVRHGLRRLDGRLHRHLAAAPRERCSRGGVCPVSSFADLRRRSRKVPRREQRPPPRGGQDQRQQPPLHRGVPPLGYRVEQFPVNVKGCRGAGVCNLGCPNAAKQGTQPRAAPRRRGGRRRGRDQLQGRGDRRARVHRDRREPGVRRAVALGAGALPDPRARDRRGGGAVNSPALLLRSRLPVRLPALGRYLTAHPALILVGEHERPITNYFGHPKMLGWVPP